MKKITLLISGILLSFYCLGQRSDASAIELQAKESATCSPEQKEEDRKTLRLETLMEHAYNGNPIALHKLGRAYKKGTLTECDYAKAFECFSKSAAQNYAPAWFDLGTMHKLGLHVPLDYEYVSCISIVSNQT